MILDGERRSRERYNGHSSAMAQVYNHMILPLANHARPRHADPLGHRRLRKQLWHARPKACGCLRQRPTLRRSKLLAANGIKFTVLAPHQCKRIRPLKNEATGRKKPKPSGPTPRRLGRHHAPLSRAFRVRRSIAVFFYNGPASRAIAFEGLLNSGDNLVARLKAGFKDSAAAAAGSRRHRRRIVRPSSQVRRNGAGLCAAPARTGQDRQAHQLRQLPRSSFRPSSSARLSTDTSWSCVHGIERWRSNCGCNGGKPGWNQAVARAAAPGSRRAARRARSAHRAGGRQALQGCLGRARRLHPGGSRPRHGDRRSLLRRAPGARALRRRSACAPSS